MARRRTKSPGGGLSDLFALMPWWACVALAGAAYLALHAFSERPTPRVQPGALAPQVGSVVTGAALKSVAAVGQYALPITLLAAAVVSATRRRQRRRLVKESADGHDAGAIDGMAWHQFELLIGEGFRRRGYLVTETGGGGADGGVALILRRPVSNGSEVVLVQCKHWRAHKVGVEVVREFYGVMAAKGAARGFVVTSGRFTAEATAFAQGRNIELIGGAQLKDLLAIAGSSEAGIAATSTRSNQWDGEMTMVVCPLCSSPMVKRLAKRGAGSGQTFYGCTTYPSCKGILPA